MTRTAHSGLSRRRRAGLTALTVAVSLLGGCARDAVPKPAAEITRGPLTVRVTIESSDPLVGDTVSITTVAQGPEEYVFDFPALPEVVGLDLARRRIDDPRPAATSGLIWSQTITSVARLSGDIELPSIPVRYARKPEGDADPVFDNEIAMPPVTLRVRSALTGADAIDQPRDIAGVIDPPWTLAEFLYEYGGGLAVALAIGGIVAAWFVFRRGREAKRPLIPADTLALRELDALAAEDLFRKGESRTHYYRLSEIVRRYIERQFSVAAPEMTTEEFLATTATRRGGLPGDAGALRRFLESCDMVKYAAWAPSADDAHHALEAARTFVRESARAVAEQRAAQTRKEAA